MKKLIEKIVEKLEEIQIENTCSDCPHKEKCDEVQENISDETTDLCGATIKALAIEIVKQTIKEYNNGWIPVSERLPKRYEYVYVTCHSLCDERPNWVADTIYVDTWGIPIVDLGNAEVIAWKKKILPEPYHPKGDEKYAEV